MLVVNLCKYILMSKIRKDPNKVAAAKARAKALTPEERKDIARKAANSRWDKKKKIPKASYTGELTIGNMVFPCSVLSDGTRILTQGKFMDVMGMYYSSRDSGDIAFSEGSEQIPVYLSSKKLRPFAVERFKDVNIISIIYRTENGQIAHGVPADIIPIICDVWIDALESHRREEIKLGDRQLNIAVKAQVLMRALARTGIIALVDEVTGYQRYRASDALSKILEDFIAKELQPWVKTFPDEFYEHLFRLRGLHYPTDTVKRPLYFGYLTNNIIYKRLAPGVLEELKNTVPKTPSGNRKHHFHRKLTPSIGHPKLREHLASVVTVMKLSKNYEDFISKLDIVHPVYGETLSIDYGQDFSNVDYDGL